MCDCHYTNVCHRTDVCHYTDVCNHTDVSVTAPMCECHHTDVCHRTDVSVTAPMFEWHRTDVWVSLHRCVSPHRHSQNSHLRNAVTSWYSLPNFITIGQSVQKVALEIDLHDFHDTQLFRQLAVKNYAEFYENPKQGLAARTR